MRKNTGSILIEAILALGISVVIITGIVTALISSLSNSNFSKNQTLATGFAQEGLEVVRSMRDTDYDIFSQRNGSYCLPGNSFALGADDGCNKNVDNVFTRKIYINNSGDDVRTGSAVHRCETTSDSIFVSSTVTWTDAKCTSGNACHKVELNSCFTNLNRVVLP